MDLPYREFENSGYSQGEMETINKEFLDIHNLWNAFVHGIQNDTAYRGLHAAPAMSDHLLSIMRGNDPLESAVAVVPEDLRSQMAIFEARMHVIALVDIMFQFGQFCVSRGLHYGNLVQCKCLAINDDELEAFRQTLPNSSSDDKDADNG